MAEVPDLTKTELSEQLTKIDSSLKTWWDETMDFLQQLFLDLG